MSRFISVAEDKFQGKSTYKTTKGLTLNLDGCLDVDIKADLRRIVLMPNEDIMVMDLNLEAIGISRWPNLNHGNVIMLVDNERFTLKPEENYHSNEPYGTSDWKYKESCFYELSENLLKKIADSNSFSMKVYGDGWSAEVTNVNAFVVYCKLFYNQVYDPKAYVDVVNNALAEFEKGSADLSSFSNINKDGSNANGGCMGVILLLIALGSSLIYAI